MERRYRTITYPYEIDRSDYDWPTFSDAEYQRRYDIMRRFMEEHELDCLVLAGSNGIWERGWANVRWASNFMGTMELDAFVVVPYEGDPTVLILGLNARLPDRIARSIVYDVRGSLNNAGALVDRIKELGLERGRIGIVRQAPWLSLHHDHMRALEEECPHAEFPEFGDEFWKKRLVLSDEEIACLEEAGRIGDAAVQAVIDNLRPGMSETDLFAIIYEALGREGGELPCMVLACGEDMRNPVSGFQRPRAMSRTISDNDVLLMEIGARDRHGYEAQTGKPIIYGDPPPLFEDLLDTMFTAYERVTDVLRPGCDAKQLREAGSVINDRGYQVVAPLVHGVFNPIDAGPFVGTSHRPDKDVVLEPGMACCVEIHPCNEDVTAGVFMGDTYVITEDGARSVNQLPPVLTRL